SNAINGNHRSLRFAVFAAAIVCLPMATALANAAEPPSEAPPPGLSPAPIRLETILSDYRIAVGRRTPGAPDTRVERWTITFGSLSGTRDEWRSGRDFRIAETLGPDETGYGRLAGRTWSVNANGQ